MSYSGADFVEDVTNAARNYGLIPEDETGIADDQELVAGQVLGALMDAARHKAALEKIRDLWPFDTAKPPEMENYHDTESAYNNGQDVAAYDAACIARDALGVVPGNKP